MGRRSHGWWLAVLLSAGCSTTIALTDRGTRVLEVSAVDVPPGCRMIGDVSIGVPPDAARPRTEEQLVTLMRNKAADMSATHVLVESRERRGAGSQEYFAGRGLAYACPEGAAAPDESEAAAPADSE